MKSIQLSTTRPIVALALLLLSTTILRASDLYTLTGTSTSTGQSITATGTNFVDLLKNASNSSAEFQTLKGQPATYALNRGSTTIIKMTRDSAGTTAIITIPSTGHSKTFTGASDSDVRKQVSDYLKQNTDNAIGKLNERLNQETKTSFVDGNPHAVTATMADDAFYRFGINRAGETYEAGGWIKGDGGTYHADGLNGYYGNLGFGFDIPFGHSAALSLGFNNEYNRLAGANSFAVAGLDIGLPITVYRTPLLDGFVWKLTPFGEGSVTLSPSTISGGWVYGGGATSSLSYITGPWTFTLGDQINYFAGANLDLGNVVLGNSQLDQWITKNGIDLTYKLGQGAFVDTGVTWTHFFHNAGVKDYYSPTLGIGLQLSDASRLRVGARGDLANGYTSVGGEISLTVSY
jgi:hypothetical protein